MAPDPSAPPTAPRPTVSREPPCLAVTPRLPGTPPQVPVSDGYPSARSDPTPSQLPAPDADSLVPRSEPRDTTGGGRWTLSLLRSRCASSAVWAGPKPHPHRPGWRALTGTTNSKDGVKPQVKRYFRTHRVIHQVSWLPPGNLGRPHASPLFVHRDTHRPALSRPAAGGRCGVFGDQRVEWGAMSSTRFAIIVIS